RCLLALALPALYKRALLAFDFLHEDDVGRRPPSRHPLHRDRITVRTSSWTADHELPVPAPLRERIQDQPDVAMPAFIAVHGLMTAFAIPRFRRIWDPAHS